MSDPSLLIPPARPGHDPVDADMPLHGAGTILNDQELLARLLMRRCGPCEAALASQALFSRFGGLGQAIAADPREIERVTGLAFHAVEELRLLRELSVRISRSEACDRSVLTSWSAVVAYVRAAIAHGPREQFRALYLDRRNALLHDEWIADGSVDHAPVYPREVIRRALELSASALVLVHNHPSGDPTPSEADVRMTRQIVDGARLFGLQIHDHLIVSCNGTTSFRSLGLL